MPLSRVFCLMFDANLLRRVAALILIGISIELSAESVKQLHAAEQGRVPNVVLVLADDLGYGDLACYGNPVIKTPHLDKFATQGMRLTQCYSAGAVCSPSRSAILTGRTPYRNGVFTWIPAGREPHLRKSEITIAKLLQGQGYATCHTGKWHLNGFFNDPRHPQPNEHGYDWWLATQNNAAPSHKDPLNFVRNGKPVGQLAGFSAPLVVNEGIEWLSKHRDPKKPFLLSVWTHEPHLPIESDPQFQDLYKDIPDADQRQHHSNITQLDAAFGRLMAALDELKLADNTLVIFTSDNGPEGDGLKGKNRGSTGGLRGRKRDVFEGGIRVPGIIRWPGHISPNQTNATPVIGSDLFATICEATKTPLPTDRVLDGGSLVPLLTGKGGVQRQRPLYWRCPIAQEWAKTAMRIGDWKIVADEPLTRFELYNVQADPQEKQELSKQEPAKFAEMQAELKQLNAEIEAEGPTWWKDYDNGGAKPVSVPGAAALLTAKRVVFLGDSITYSGQYIAYLETYLTERYPEKQFDFIDLGLPSETCSGLSEPGHAGGAFPRPDVHERLERVLSKLKPDLVVACYGMNCGMYYPFAPERFQKYQEGMRSLRQAVAAHGGQVIHLTPPTFDPIPLAGRTLPAGKDAYDRPFEGYNNVLGRFSQFLLARRQQGWTVIDIHGPMDQHLATRRKDDPKYVLAGDGVHASPTGHWLMAEQVLQAIDGAVMPIEATIDATAGTSATAGVTDLKKSDKTLSFQWKSRLPMFVDPQWNADSLKLEQFADKFDRYRLQISGLADGKYELLDGDRAVGTFTAAEAQAGLNLLNYPELTTNKRAKELFQQIQQRQRILTDAWLNECGHKRPGMGKGLPVAEATAKADEISKKVRDLAQPAVMLLQVVPK
ncbi:MAG: N-acetylgalactosamine 6-sulfate sulfatase [Planctomycetaceae bacterium]|nr:N-acetylgalactosamine 6-sulfate sulfatase [Planctomycetaceae bacterium]